MLHSKHVVWVSVFSLCALFCSSVCALTECSYDTTDRAALEARGLSECFVVLSSFVLFRACSIENIERAALEARGLGECLVVLLSFVRVPSHVCAK